MKDETRKNIESLLKKSEEVKEKIGNLEDVNDEKEIFETLDEAEKDIGEMIEVIEEILY